MNRRGRALLSVVALVAAGGCKARDRGWAVEQAEIEGELEELRALGYIDYAEAPDAAASGAIVHRAAGLSPGYYLYGTSTGCAARLVDVAGREVHAWRMQPCRYWRATELTPEGDLLVLGMDPPGGSGRPEFIARLAWDGAVRWKRMLTTHHDLELRPDGTILVLTLTHTVVPEYALPILDDQLTFLDPDGQVLRQLSMWRMIHAGATGFVPERVTARRGTHDVLHTNSVETMRRAELVARHPLYALGNVLVASRRQNAVFVFDPVGERLVWSFGPGLLDGPHDATVLDDGNLLVFDNGWRRGRSRVVEIDPLAGAIVWEYPGKAGREFFSKSRGSAQRLGNGNTLLGNSNTGQALEVDRSGQPVWEFNNPHLDSKGRRGVILRIRHLPAALVEPLLARGR